MVKGQRRKASYKALVERLKLQLAADNDLGMNRHLSHITEEDLSTGSTPADNLSPMVPAVNQLHEALSAEELSSELVVELTGLAERAVSGESILDLTAEVVLRALNIPPARVRSGNRSRGAPRNARQKKQERFRQLKKLYNSNRQRLAEVLFDGAASSDHAIPLAECFQYFKSIFGRKSLPDTERFVMKASGPQFDLSAPISLQEIEIALKKMPKRSSPGPDRATVAMLSGLPRCALYILFNIWLYYKDVPKTFKLCRTVLIPKKQPPQSPKDFRPITIASVFYRLFTKIISVRLASCVQLNPRQKAFMPGVNGCGENAFLLHTALIHSRRQGKELSLATLDVAKAFDSVSHSSIQRALRRHGAHENSIVLVSNLLADSFTRIEHTEGKSDLIPMTCGVKQGDPLSPLLFSLVMDELLDQLNDLDGGFHFTDEHQLNCLAFADDILLMSSSKAGLQSLLLHSYRFFKLRHLRLNVDKCFTLRLYRIPKARSVCVDVLSEFYLDPVEPTTVLPRFTPSDYLSYLGVDFNPYGKRCKILERVESMLQCVARAELKPQQKIQMIRAHLIPRLLYSFCNGNPTAGTAASADRLIRQKIKALLHLPQSTMSDHYFYLPMKEGGLGLLSLSESVDFSMLTLYRKLAASRDPVVRAATGLWFNVYRCSRLARRHNLEDISERSILQAKTAALERHRTKFAATYQGSGHREFVEACSNLWIEGERMTGRSFIASIKARTSLVPTRLQTLRGRAEPGDQRVLCRRCGHISGSPESLAHISQNCTFTHGLIVRRHDVIVKKLASLAEASGFTVTVEPTLRHEDQAFKPDLIAVKGDKAWALDVAIPFETTDALARRHVEKCRKYACLGGPVLKLTGAKVYKTGSIVIGARGAWCSKNNGTLNDMDWALPEKIKALLCTMTLERTNQLISWFMRTTPNLAFHTTFRTRGLEGHESVRPTNFGSNAHHTAE
uniref:Reverse transcriptase domain-containing protein n=1 Tax=Trichuris muris TaxID=70415 RepID=A0A5S6Q1M1_TRIMR